MTWTKKDYLIFLAVAGGFFLLLFTSPELAGGIIAVSLVCYAIYSHLKKGGKNGQTGTTR